MEQNSVFNFSHDPGQMQQPGVIQQPEPSSGGSKSVLGAIISGLLAFGAAGVGYYNSRRQAREQERLMRLQNELNVAQWNRENEYNTPAEQMRRFREAGLSTDLIYGQTNQASSITPSSSVPTVSLASNPFLDSVQTFNMLERERAEINNINADTKVKEQNVVESQHNIVLSDKEFEELHKMNESTLVLQRSQMNLNKAEEFLKLKESDKFDERFTKEMNLMQSQIDKNMADKNLSDAQKKLVNEQYTQLFAAHEANLRKAIAEADNAETLVKKMNAELWAMSNELAVNLYNAGMMMPNVVKAVTGKNWKDVDTASIAKNHIPSFMRKIAAQMGMSEEEYIGSVGMLFQFFSGAFGVKI